MLHTSTLNNTTNKRSGRHSDVRYKDQYWNDFEIVEKKDLDKRFSNLKNTLIVKFGQLNTKHQSRALKTDKYYILSQSLPFVFEVDCDIYHRDIDYGYIGDVVQYLSQLRRIRIIQSLKSKDVILSNLINKSGQYIDKGKLELTFIHPLLNTKIKSLSYPAQFNKSELDEIYSLIHTGGDYHAGNQMIRFPENCCILSIRLARKQASWSFECLLWFMEQRVRGKKVYFCSVKLDLHTKVNLFFLPEESSKLDKQKAPDADLNLILSNIEVIIGSTILNSGRNEKYEFYSSIKKSKLNESEHNYRFNGSNAPRQMAEQNAHRPPDLLNRPPPQMQTLMDFSMPRIVQQSLGMRSYNHENSQKELFDSRFNLTQAESTVWKSSVSCLFENIQANGSMATSIPSEILFSSEEMLQTSNDRAKCMALQNVVKMLDSENDTVIISMLMRSILPNLVIIACGVYGNFLIQILTTKLSVVQRKQLILTSTKELAFLCLDTKGIFCVQTLVDHLEQIDEYELFFKIFENHLDSLIKDGQAGFVLKKTVQTFPLEYTGRLLDLIKPRLLEYASDKYGICVIKFIIKRYESDIKLFSHIVREFSIHAWKGKLNSHFNFGLQHLIEIANQNRWYIADLEDIMACFFTYEAKTKIRSKAVAQTIKQIYNYHSHEFLSNRVMPLLLNQFELPLTHNEIDLLATAKKRWPEWSDLQLISKTTSNK